MNSRRVVITGMGVVAPNGIGLKAFETALREGHSGITFQEDLERLKFSCQVGGVPAVDENLKASYFTPLQMKTLKSLSIIYGCMAAIDAWADAGFTKEREEDSPPDWDTGCLFGSGLTGIEVLRESIYKIDDLNVRRLGSTIVEQTMGSGISAHIGGLLGLGNQVTTNSSACSTGTEAIIMGYEKVAGGHAKRMVVGSCDSPGPYVWGGFDSMRVLNRKSNEAPEKASRPMSATASGFVPGSGAGAMILEDMESAQERGATIYAEVLGGYINSGGQRNGGTMTAPNSEGIQRCIQGALATSGVKAGEVDAISGHLTSTMGDVLEVNNWSVALDRKGTDFPLIHSMKSMVGHCLGAAGAIECVGVALQLFHNFIHPSINCEDLHPEIAAVIDESRVPRLTKEDAGIDIFAKSSFGFGDVNSCMLFKKYQT